MTVVYRGIKKLKYQKELGISREFDALETLTGTLTNAKCLTAFTNFVGRKKVIDIDDQSDGTGSWEDLQFYLEVTRFKEKDWTAKYDEMCKEANEIHKKFLATNADMLVNTSSITRIESRLKLNMDITSNIFDDRITETYAKLEALFEKFKYSNSYKRLKMKILKDQELMQDAYQVL